MAQRALGFARRLTAWEQALTCIATGLRRQVRADAGARCGYCLSPEILTGMPLTIEHIVPEARDGATIRSNLWLACHRCNEFKGSRITATDPEMGIMVSLFNPREHEWSEHFRWDASGAIITGLSSTGRATVDALRLNNDFVVAARRFWIEAGWWPPA
jgi:hypothetical protein